VLAHQITGLENHWRELALPVRDFLPSASRFRVRFTAADSAGGTVVEAAVDDAVLYDAALAVTEAPPIARLGLERARPNPTRGEVGLSLRLPRAGALDAEVLDLQGRVVRVLARGPAAAGERTLRWDGRDALGREAAPGLYLVRVRAAGETRTARVLRLE
jgi:hypothetical protein